MTSNDQIQAGDDMLTWIVLAEQYINTGEVGPYDHDVAVQLKLGIVPQLMGMADLADKYGVFQEWLGESDLEVVIVKMFADLISRIAVNDEPALIEALRNAAISKITGPETTA